MRDSGVVHAAETRQVNVGWLVALLPLAVTLAFASLIDDVANAGAVTLRLPWVESLGVTLAFNVDGLALLFALIIGGIGTLVVLYASSYFGAGDDTGRFYAIILLFMVSMLGTVTADNVITLFVFWELTSITSYLLIGFKHDKAESRNAALQALLVTGAGGLALLAGLILLGVAGGSYDFTALLNGDVDIRTHALYGPIVVLVLLGAFTKSAQVPFHFWLPGAMAAPTPVSAYLHSATMVKAGVYLLARLTPLLGGTALWVGALGITGGLTMLVGAYLALQHRDLKRILAYSTVSALGTLVLLIGLGTTLALKAALVFLLGHALYKGALFMVAGSIDHATGTRDVARLGGLRRVMPVTALAGGLAALSMAGLPPFLGFVGKEIIYESTLNQTAVVLVTGAALLANTLTVVAAGMAAYGPFWGAPGKAVSDKAHEVAPAMWLGPVVLAGLGLAAGLFVGQVGTALITPALSAVRGEPTTAKLALWHGLNLMLLLSAVTVGGGALLYTVRRRLEWTPRIETFVERWGPQSWYPRAIDALFTIARVQTRVLQHGRMRYYLLVIILAASLLAGAAWLRGAVSIATPEVSSVWVHELGLGTLILLATVAVLRASTRLAAVAALGVIGFSIGLIYLLFGAPDLAMTQFAVETLTVILLVLVLYRLPRFAQFSTRASRLRDAVIALGFGALMTVVVMTVTASPVSSTLADYFVENSVLLAQGRNVVNVILVDFRALDTFGEVTVLAIAALGVFALIKLRVNEHKPD